MSENEQKDPDIIITDEDLIAADEHVNAAKEFFANPNPRPPKPTALVDVVCSKTKRKFAAYFEQTKSNSWILIEYIDDSVIGSPQYARSVTIQKDLVQGSVDYSLVGTKLRCPYCQALSMVKCGKCNNLSCHPDGQQGSKFSCPICGESGTLSGHIKSLDGSNGKKR